MKWLVYLVVLGFVEVVAIGKLHGQIGIYHLIGLYLLTTIIGAVFLLIQLPRFRRSWIFMKQLDKGTREDLKKFGDPDFKPSAGEIEQLRPMLFFMLYFIAAAHIAIPGLVSDVIGIVLVVPFISNAYLNQRISKAVRKAGEDASARN
jgi:UPF0716 family protein affecting phage T7 exclusion